eukprot:COSAG06_NODE_54614_length_293_cov_1.628866_1_plen_90_part_01
MLDIEHVEREMALREFVFATSCTDSQARACLERHGWSYESAVAEHKEREESVKKVVSACRCNEEAARTRLQDTGWNFEQAVAHTRWCRKG